MSTDLPLTKDPVDDSHITPSTATDPQLAAVLAAREARWQHRLTLTRLHRSNLLSLTICLPLRYRTSPALKHLFDPLCRQVIEALTELGFSPVSLPPWDGADGPAFFAVIPGCAQQIKGHCVSLENTLALGRMLDIDLSDKEGNPISRSDLGLPPRRCFVCSRPAAICVSRKLHSPADIDLAVQELLKQVKHCPPL